jgi:tripartite-type tricarboxylate transporter receptor subunit TctC
MKPSLNRIVAGIAFVAAISVVHAQDAATYPSKPVQVIVPWAPGGIVDNVGRAVVRAIGASLGQPFIVTNRDGAAGTIGTAQLAAAKPDGYTLGWGPITPITNATHLMKSVSYEFDSFQYICQVFENTFAVAVAADSQFKSLPDLLAYLAANPGKVTYGHLGVGSISHLSMENVLHARNLKVIDAPYRGSPVILPDLQTGRLAFGIANVSDLMGRPVRILGIFADRRHPAIPDVPTLSELGLPSLQPALNGLIAPKGTPADLARRLEQACDAAVRSEEFRATMQKFREPIIYYGRDAFTERSARDNSDKAQLVKTLGLIPR